MEYQELLKQFSELDLAVIPSRRHQKDEALEIYQISSRRRNVLALVGTCNTESELAKWVAGYRYAITP